jgi:hypothetical protein
MVQGASAPYKWLNIRFDHGSHPVALSLFDDDHPQYGPIVNGFEDRTKFAMEFSDINGGEYGMLNIYVPTGQTGRFWSQGVRHECPDTFDQSLAINVSVNPAEGQWFFFLDGAGTLDVTQTFTDTLVKDYALVAYVFWDADLEGHIFFAELRHGRKMDADTRLRLLHTEGAKYEWGLIVGDLATDQSGASAAHAQCSVSGGVVWAADLTHAAVDATPQPLSAPAEIPLYYWNTVGTWRRCAATTYPVTTTGTGRAAWNDQAVGDLTEATDGYFVLTHLFATGSVETPIIGIVGQAEYATLADAEAGALVEMDLILRDPDSGSLLWGQIAYLAFEWAPIGTIIFQTNDTYANAVKSRTRQTADGLDYIDWRRRA